MTLLELPKHREAHFEASNTGRKRLRRQMFERQEGLCAYCDEPMTLCGGGRMASFDHVVPESLGGTQLVLACWQCNRLKGSMTPERLRRLADRIEELTSGKQVG